MALTREQAWDLLNEYNKGEFHLKHGQIVGDVMRWYANELGYGCLLYTSPSPRDA